KDAQDVGLRSSAVNVIFRTPIILGDTDFGAGIVTGDPPFHAWDEHDDLVDPGFIDVVGVPKRASGAAALELGGGRNVVAAHGAVFGVAVQREVVEQALIGLGGALVELAQQPGHVIHAAVGAAVRQIAPAVLAAVLEVGAAVEI